MLGLGCYSQPLASYSELGLLSGCRVQASPLVASLVEHSLEGVWAQLLQLPGSGACVLWLWCMGLVVPGHVESSWTMDQTHVHGISRQILIHHAMREVQNLDILDEFFHLNSSLWPAVQQVLQCIISCSNVRTSSFGLGEILQLMKNNIFSCSTTW